MFDILAGDVGGTKTLLGAFRGSPDGLAGVFSARFASQHYASFDSVLADFLAQCPVQRFAAACLAVAGPVIDGRCRVTNLPWRLSDDDLAEHAHAPRAD